LLVADAVRGIRVVDVYRVVAVGGRHVGFVAVGAVLDGDDHLVEVVHARGAGGGLADLLDGGQEQPDEDGDDGDHHQQLHQREPTPAPQETTDQHESASKKDGKGKPLVRQGNYGSSAAGSPMSWSCARVLCLEYLLSVIRAKSSVKKKR